MVCSTNGRMLSTVHLAAIKHESKPKLQATAELAHLLSTMPRPLIFTATLLCLASCAMASRQAAVLLSSRSIGMPVWFKISCVCGKRRASSSDSFSWCVM